FLLGAQQLGQGQSGEAQAAHVQPFAPARTASAWDGAVKRTQQDADLQCSNYLPFLAPDSKMRGATTIKVRACPDFDSVLTPSARMACSERKLNLAFRVAVTRSVA